MKAASSYHATVNQICFAAYALILLLFFGYSAIGSNFSEIHIKLSFLDFPIFIGELVLFILAILAVVKGWLTGVVFKKRFLILFSMFLIFVVTKAFVGYSQFGPLALRNAAMFYYVLYGLLAYFFYCPEFLSNKYAIMVSLILCAIPASPYFRSYYLLTYIALLIFLVPYIYSFRLKLLITVFVLLFYPFQQLVGVSRGAFLSNVAAVIYCIVAILFTIPSLKRGRRIAVSLVSIGFLFLLSFMCMNQIAKKRIAAIFDFGRWQTQYSEVIELSQIRLNDYKPKKFDIKVYEPNTPDNIGIGGAPLRQRKEESLAMDQKATSDSRTLSNTSELNKTISDNKKFHSKLVELSLDSLHTEKTVVKLEASAVYENPKNLFKLMETVFPEKPSDANDQNELARNAKLLARIGEREDQSRSSLVWRFFLWNDIFDEIREEMFSHPGFLLYGFDFGRPIRSKRQEAILFYLPQITGWLEPHNFLIHVFYRSGLIGVLMLALMFWWFWNANLRTIRLRDREGIFLFSILVYWFSFSLTMVILELPHYAICFWSFCGFTAAHIKQKSANKT